MKEGREKRKREGRMGKKMGGGGKGKRKKREAGRIKKTRGCGERDEEKVIRGEIHVGCDQCDGVCSLLIPPYRRYLVWMQLTL